MIPGLVPEPGLSVSISLGCAGEGGLKNPEIGKGCGMGLQLAQESGSASLGVYQLCQEHE